MCKSKAEGGARCYGHTSKEYAKAVSKVQNLEQELDRKWMIMANLSQQMEALDHAWEDGQIYDEEYNRQSDVVVAHYTKGNELIAQNEKDLAVARENAAKKLAEVRTTYTGLKQLEKAIENETDDRKRKALLGVYNASKRVGARRAVAFKEYQKNQELAKKYDAEAEARKAEADAIVVSSPEHAAARDEILLDASLAKARAHIARNNGRVESQALINAKTGELLPAKLVDGKFGKVWAIIDPKNPTAKDKKLISPPRGKTYASREAFWANKGIRLGTVWVPGEAAVVKNEDGTSKVVVRRTDGGYSPYAMRGQDNVYTERVKAEKAQAKG